MTIQEAYIDGFLKAAQEANADPADLIRMRSRIDGRTLDRFAREDEALKSHPGKTIAKHTAIGGAGGAALGALIGAITSENKENAILGRKNSRVGSALALAALGGLVGSGIGCSTGSIAAIVKMLKSNIDRRRHVNEFLDSMYMTPEKA